MQFLLTCDPGLEDIAESEIKEKDKSSRIERFFNFQGKLLVNSKIEKLVELHSIHHIIKLIKTFHLKQATINEIKKELENIDIEEMEEVNTFRVTSQRFGDHNFSSIDMQKIAGEVFLEKYRKKVDLENYDLNIRFDLIGNFGFVGIQLTRESLYKRYKKVFNHQAAIKSTIAFAMLKLANLKNKDVLLDPMCGSGTIPMEAASLFSNNIKIIAGDKSQTCINGAKENASINKLQDFIEFKILDATKLEKYISNVDKIVTNPPYGVRIAKKVNLKDFYKRFLLSANNVLNERMVIITLKANMFRNIVFSTKKYKIFHERVVESGGIYPHIFVLEKI
ncbi:MAG: THUMP domain-containing protein [Candidatus Aenigmatarchaeota archaeon]